MVTPDQLDAWEALAREATPGPWREGQAGNTRIYGPDCAGEASGPVADALHRTDPMKRAANRAYIAIGPDNFLSLITEVRETGRVNACQEERIAELDAENERLRLAFKQLLMNSSLSEHQLLIVMGALGEP